MSEWTPKKGGKPRKPGTVRFADAEADGRKYKAAAPEQVSDTVLYVAEKLANLTGFNFVFYQTEADSAGRYKGANGFYRDGTVYLDVNAGANKTTEQSAVLLTAAHEMTHAIRENFEEGYNALRDFVTDHLLDEGENLIQMARDKIRRSAKPAEMTLGDAVEEVVADACEEMLGNTRYAELMAQENPTLAQSIKNWITDFAEKIKTAVSPDARRHREAEVMRKFAAELQEIWDKALVGATRASESGELRVESEELSEGEAESGTKYSLRDKETPTYDELTKKKPIKIVDINTGIEAGTYADMKEAAITTAKTKGWFDRPHINDDTDSFIFITPKSFTHAYTNLKADFGEDTIRCMAHIPEIIKNAVLVNVNDPKDKTKRERKVYTFFGAVRGAAGTEPVKLTVKSFDFKSLDSLPQNIRTFFEKNGVLNDYNSLYDTQALEVIGIEGIRKESDASGKGSKKSSLARATSDSEIRVADLLELVKGDAA